MRTVLIRLAVGAGIAGIAALIANEAGQGGAENVGYWFVAAAVTLAIGATGAD